MSNNYSGKRRKDSFFNLYFTSAISISLTLFMVGLITFLMVWTQQLSDYTRENVIMTLVLKNSVAPADRQTLDKYLSSARYVKDHTVISKEDALTEYIATMGDDPTEFLGFNPLHTTIELHLHAAFANNDSISMVEKELTACAAVQEIVYQKDIISTLNVGVRRITLILSGVAGILLLISIVLINNTIHISMYSKRFIINTMKLVGAGNRFIRRPFLKRYFISGLFSALIALTGLAGVVYYLQTEIGEALPLWQWQLYIPVVVVVAAMGLLITSLSALVCVNRYLRMKTDDLYYI
ncbi:MAG: permease-like cell division protein FtsX [Prevotellaceae bacterium]|jgi:cell division transport system permease protein|nr:permease-like cell division protein FtsX [Prevotellaceae bacterium]